MSTYYCKRCDEIHSTDARWCKLVMCDLTPVVDLTIHVKKSFKNAAVLCSL
jgi:hypothetical protein